MSHPANDALADRAVDLAIEELINGGMSENHPFFDKAVDRRAAKILESLLEG